MNIAQILLTWCWKTIMPVFR